MSKKAVEIGRLISIDKFDQFRRENKKIEEEFSSYGCHILLNENWPGVNFIFFANKITKQNIYRDIRYCCKKKIAFQPPFNIRGIVTKIIKEKDKKLDIFEIILLSDIIDVQAYKHVSGSKIYMRRMMAEEFVI